MIVSKKFRHKVTGEVRTQIPLLDINDWEEVEEDCGKETEKDKPSLHLKGEICPQCKCKDIVKANDERMLQCLACGFLFEGKLSHNQ